MTTLSMPELDNSLSLLPIEKDWKKKMKLDTKMYCLQIQRTDHLISKKHGELK